MTDEKLKVATLRRTVSVGNGPPRRSVVTGGQKYPVMIIFPDNRLCDLVQSLFDRSEVVCLTLGNVRGYRCRAIILMECLFADKVRSSPVYRSEYLRDVSELRCRLSNPNGPIIRI